MADTKLPSTAKPARGKVLAFAAVASMMLGACLQTDPEGPDPVIVPEDNGRRAGASSSTNWPTEIGENIYKIHGRTDSSLDLFLFQLLEVPPFEIVPAKLTGKLSFYRAGLIPALENPTTKEYRFQNEDTLTISSEFLNTLNPGSAKDTVDFNIRAEIDSFQVWFMGFSYSKSQKKFLHSPFSDISGNSEFMKVARCFFKGNLKVDTSLIPPVAGVSEFSFYIPGTPVFGMLSADTVKIGPLPKSKYPFRLLRLSHPASQPKETLVEAWEVTVDQDVYDSSMTIGPKVLSVTTQGILNLRNPE